MVRHTHSHPGIFYLLLAAVVLIAVAATPTSWPIKSLAETHGIYAQLGLNTAEGTPVLVFVSQGCLSCQELETELTRRAIPYQTVNVSNNPTAAEINAHLGRDIFGVVVTRSTPTVIVGTQVIRGGDVNVILAALANQLQPLP